MNVRFLMVAEIDVPEDEEHVDPERDAESMLDAYREAAAYTVGTEFGVSIARATDADALQFDVRTMLRAHSFVPAVIKEGGDSV